MVLYKIFSQAEKGGGGGLSQNIAQTLPELLDLDNLGVGPPPPPYAYECK